MNTQKSPLLLIAVLRFSDKTVIASHTISREVTIEGIRECIASNADIRSGKRYTAQGDCQAIHYTQDAQGRIYAVVTLPKYPPRIAFMALDEMVQKFCKDLGPRCASATENSLSKAALPIFQEITAKFTDPTSWDKLSSVQDKLDVVKTTMQENIHQILQNDEKLLRIDDKANHLREQAGEFKNKSKQLSDKMFWKMVKMRLLIGGLIVAVLIIIIVPIAVTSSSTASSGKK